MSFLTSKLWIKEIPATVWVISFVTLLINFSSIMIFSLSPLYITQVFGLAVFHLGILEGLIEFVSWLTRIFSGVISDYFNKRKPLLVLAYTLTILSRPLFALAPTIVWVYFAKLTDRISNGLQATPREALISHAAPHGLKGTCYGLRQSLGVLGSLLGAVSIMFLMRSSDNDFQFIFWIAAIPPLLALLVVIYFVKDPPNAEISHHKETKKHISLSLILKQIPNLNKNFWAIILISGIFMLSNYSGAYRILHAEKNGVAIADVSWVMIVQNLGIMLAAFPMGRLSDKFSRRSLLSIGFICTIIANFCFIISTSFSGLLLGTLLWGAQMGMNQSILLSMVAESTPKNLRGSGFGIYYFVNAFALCFANIFTGWLFETQGSAWAFASSGLIATLSLLLIPLIKSSDRLAHVK